MNKLLEFARENGWAQLLPRVARGFVRRVRDSLTARRLQSPQFRSGASPRLLGLAHMRVGAGFQAGDHLWLEALVQYRGTQYEPKLIIGKDVTLSDFVHIACLHSVTIGDGLLCGSRVIITDHAHGQYDGEGQSAPAIPPARRFLASSGAVVIGRNVWLGDGVAVLPGANIGDGAVIGANSVVTRTIPTNTMAVGSPARIIRIWDAAAGKWQALPSLQLDKLNS